MRMAKRWGGLGNDKENLERLLLRDPFAHLPEKEINLIFDYYHNYTYIENLNMRIIKGLIHQGSCLSERIERLVKEDLAGTFFNYCQQGLALAERLNSNPSVFRDFSRAGAFVARKKIKSLLKQEHQNPSPKISATILDWLKMNYFIEKKYFKFLFQGWSNGARGKKCTLNNILDSLNALKRIAVDIAKRKSSSQYHWYKKAYDHVLVIYKLRKNHSPNFSPQDELSVLHTLCYSSLTLSKVASLDKAKPWAKKCAKDYCGRMKEIIDTHKEDFSPEQTKELLSRYYSFRGDAILKDYHIDSKLKKDSNLSWIENAYKSYVKAVHFAEQIEDYHFAAYNYGFAQRCAKIFYYGLVKEIASLEPGQVDKKQLSKMLKEKEGWANLWYKAEIGSSQLALNIKDYDFAANGFFHASKAIEEFVKDLSGLEAWRWKRKKAACLVELENIIQEHTLKQDYEIGGKLTQWARRIYSLAQAV